VLYAIVDYQDDMRKPIPIYIYKNQEFWRKAASIAEAAEKTSVTPTQVRNILYHLGKQPCTKQGFSYFTKPLTDDEREQLPCMDTDPKGYTRVDGRSCRQIVEAQEYEVNCNDGKVTYQPAAKKERIEAFKRFLFTKFRERWLLIPQAQATLERQYIREFLDSIQ